MKPLNLGMVSAKPLSGKPLTLLTPGGGKHTVKLNLVTTNFEEAVRDASYIMMAVPAFGTKDFFGRIIPYLEDGQTIIKPK